MGEKTPIEVPGSSEAVMGQASPEAVLPPAPGPHRRALSRLAAWVLVPAVLGVLVFAQARLFREATCETYDEYTYLRMGMCIYRQNDFKSLDSPMCPPLPILLEYGLSALSAGSLPDTEGWERESPSLMWKARLMTSLLVGVPLVWLVYAWLARRRGWVVGALGGGLVALSPSILAAASIATTDACFTLFAVLALAALHRHQVQPTRWSFLAVGAAIGLALASKQTAVILFAVALVEILLKLPGRKPAWTRVDFGLRSLLWVGNRLGVLIVLAFLVDEAAYGFRVAPRFNSIGTHITLPVIIPMVLDLLPNGESIMETVRQWGAPLALDTFVGQMEHASSGHHAFLMGQHSFRGWWYFFPVAIALKSTPAELVMMALVVFLACRPGTWRDPARRLWLGSIVVMLGVGMGSSINIGHRYMLFIYPLVVLLAADWLGELALRRPGRAIVAGVLLLAWQAVSIVGIAPHYLGYFNSFCGGPSQGYRYLVDSSLDWGQDLPSLSRELEARNYHQVALGYFGTGRIFNYGLRTADWLDIKEEAAAKCDWLAISATPLQGAYEGTSHVFEHFGSLPSVRVGYSIFLYDLKDPRVRAAWNALRGIDQPPPSTTTNPGAPVIGPGTSAPQPRPSSRLAR